MVNGFFRGIVYRRLRQDSLHSITQKATDGAIARFYTADEFRECVGQPITQRVGVAIGESECVAVAESIEFGLTQPKPVIFCIEFGQPESESEQFDLAVTIAECVD